MSVSPWPSGLPGPYSNLMRVILCACAIALVGIVTILPLHAEDPSQLEQAGFVNDFGNFIDADSSDKISAICKELEAKTGDRLLFVTVKDTNGRSSGNFAEALLNRWIESPEQRDRSMAVVMNAQGNLGFSYGSTLEATLSYQQVEAIFRSSLDVGGRNLGEKYLYLAKHLAEALRGGPSVWERAKGGFFSIWVLFTMIGGVVTLMILILVKALRGKG